MVRGMVTPRLFVGITPGWPTTEVTTAEEAFAAIDSGLTAVFADGCWGEAQKTLDLLRIETDWQRVVLGRAGATRQVLDELIPPVEG